MYLVKFARLADKDKARLKAAGLEKSARALLGILMKDPFQNPPPYEKLVGNLRGNYSRRINIQHQLVYSVLENTDGYVMPSGERYEGIVLVKRMWTHYDR